MMRLPRSPYLCGKASKGPYRPAPG